MKLLLVEDDLRAAKALERGLRQNGFSVDVAASGDEGLRKALGSPFDLLLLDVMLPGLDGFTLLSEVRAQGHATPVIFLTARDALPDRLRGLSLGGGDYVVKPFAFSELLVRVNNLLGRSQASEAAMLELADLTLDPLQRKVYRSGKRLDLTLQEFAVLRLLLANQGQIVTRARIAEELWETAFYADPNLVDAAIHRLRKKVDEPFEAKLIRTRKGVGYLMESGDV